MRAVIFDCDGTLVDSEPLAWRAWRDLLARHGYQLLPEDIELTRGRGWPEIPGHFAGVVPEKGPYDRSDGRSVYFRDPDDHLVEIFWLDPAFLAKSRR